MIGALLDRLVPWLDRHVPHDTLNIGGRPYMHRWYLFGYAPLDPDPNAPDLCAVCRSAIVSIDGRWSHVDGSVLDVDHDVEPMVKRPGWWWDDHGIGAVRLHKTVASDDSRAYHDHPWPFLSIGLAGAYVERTPLHVERDADGRVTACDRVGHPSELSRLFRAPFLNRKRAADLHVLDVHRGPVWSLFLTRPKVRSWGFAGPFGWLPWREFDEQYPERDAWTS